MEYLVNKEGKKKENKTNAVIACLNQKWTDEAKIIEKTGASASTVKNLLAEYRKENGTSLRAPKGKTKAKAKKVE